MGADAGAWVVSNRPKPIPTHRLGTVPDRASGMSTRTVQSIRVRMGIQAYVRPRAVPVKADPVRKAAPVKPVVAAPEPKPRPTPAPKPVRTPKPPPAPKAVKVKPAPRVVVPSMSVRRQLRQPEEEPKAGVRPEMVAPTPLADLSLYSTRERAIIRAATTGKPMAWILATFRGVSEDEITELLNEANP